MSHPLIPSKLPPWTSLVCPTENAASRKGQEWLLSLARKKSGCCCYKVLLHHCFRGWGVLTTCVKGVCCMRAVPHLLQGRSSGLGKGFKGWILPSAHQLYCAVPELRYGTDLHGVNWCCFSHFLGYKFTITESSETQICWFFLFCFVLNYNRNFSCTKNLLGN